MSKSELSRVLSKVKDFENPKISLEQYKTPSGLAADIGYTASIQGDLDGSVVDLGGGTGVLGISALLSGCEDVTFVEKDEEAIEILRENLERFGISSANYTIILGDVREIKNNFDVVLMNPPFSVHSEEGVVFWEKAFEIGEKVYGMCMEGFYPSIKELSENFGFERTDSEVYSVNLPSTFGFHTEEVEEIEVEVLVFTKV
jgi:putative methylase